MRNNTKKGLFMQYLLPFSLTILVILIDQITKALVVHFVRVGEIVPVIDDFFRIEHVRNKALAFSLGHTLPEEFRGVAILILQLAGVTALVLAYFKLKELTSFQRWCLAVAIGGGTGNLIDRIFRPDGVVDFLSFKFYGLFGLERWPTFNAADSVLVVTLIILFLSLFLSERKKDEKSVQKKGKDE